MAFKTPKHLHVNSRPNVLPHYKCNRKQEKQFTGRLFLDCMYETA